MNLHHKFYFRPESSERPFNIVSQVEGDVCMLVESPKEVHKGLVFSDFSANNLISSGNSDLLKNRSQYSVNNLESISSVESVVNNIPEEHLLVSESSPISSNDNNIN